MNNMGAIKRNQIRDFAKCVLEEFSGWKMEFTDNAPPICIHDRKLVLILNSMTGGYPWEAKEMVLHEAAHINTWPEDMVHGSTFYKEYIRLLWKHMVGVGGGLPLTWEQSLKMYPRC